MERSASAITLSQGLIQCVSYTHPMANRSACGINMLTCKVGQNRIFTPYMTVYMVVSLPNVLYTHRIYLYMVLANPTHAASIYPCGFVPTILVYG